MLNKNELLIKLHNSYCLPRYIKNYNEADRLFVSICDMIASMPTIDAEPVTHGKWKTEQHDIYDIIVCSECGAMFDAPMIHFNYCPNCGVDMTIE